MTKLKNSNCAQVVTQLENSYCDKTQISTKLKNSNSDKFKNSNCDETQKHKL